MTLGVLMTDLLETLYLLNALFPAFGPTENCRVYQVTQACLSLIPLLCISKFLILYGLLEHLKRKKESAAKTWF